MNNQEKYPGNKNGAPGVYEKQAPPTFGGAVNPGVKTSGMAIASLVLAIVGVLTALLGIGLLLLLISLVLGIVALVKINKRPHELKGMGLALAGVIISGASPFVIGVLAAIAIPNFIQYRHKAYDASAISAGMNARLAEEVFYAEHPNESKRYTSDLGDLVDIDKNLLNDPAITFVFSHASEKGFTLYTTHAQGSGKKHTYTN